MSLLRHTESTSVAQSLSDQASRCHNERVAAVFSRLFLGRVPPEEEISSPIKGDGGDMMVPTTTDVVGGGKCPKQDKMLDPFFGMYPTPSSLSPGPTK